MLYDKPLIWLSGEVKTPPFSSEARIEVGALLRMLQNGEMIGMPHSRPMPSVGRGCHELRVRDQDKNWRLVYYIAYDVVVILDVFAKSTQRTPQEVIDVCKRRLRRYLTDCGN